MNGSMNANVWAGRRRGGGGGRAEEGRTTRAGTACADERWWWRASLGVHQATLTPAAASTSCFNTCQCASRSSCWWNGGTLEGRGGAAGGRQQGGGMGAWPDGLAWPEADGPATASRQRQAAGGLPGPPGTHRATTGQPPRRIRPLTSGRPAAGLWSGAGHAACAACRPAGRRPQQRGGGQGSLRSHPLHSAMRHATSHAMAHRRPRPRSGCVASLWPDQRTKMAIASSSCSAEAQAARPSGVAA